MKKTENTVTTNTKTENTVTNSDIKIIGRKFVFVINNDEKTELTDIACKSFIEWLATPQNSKKYINRWGIVGGDWQIDISDVTEFIHIGTAYDSLSGGNVDIIYIKFENAMLNRIVYIDNKLRTENKILLPIGDNVEYIPFDFKYQNQLKTTTRKTTQKSTPKTTAKTENKTNTTKKSTTTKTENKTPTKTMAKTENKKVVAK